MIVSAIQTGKSFNTCSSCEEQPRLVRVRRHPLSFNTCSSCEEQLNRAPLARLHGWFQYMLLLRGATKNVLRRNKRKRFQYMLLLRGATPCSFVMDFRGTVSIHAPLARSNIPSIFARSVSPFQYMLLLRGATTGWTRNGAAIGVSIHAPLARSNSLDSSTTTVPCSFNTCSSCEEQLETDCANADFVGGFNTCSSCEEQLAGIQSLTALPLFQYMLLLRGATNIGNADVLGARVSIHAPLARSNTGDIFISMFARCFNTCSSCEEQHVSAPFEVTGLPVSIHAPLARSNFTRAAILNPSLVSIHAPLARSNGSVPSPSRRTLRFNTCSSCEEQLQLHCRLFQRQTVSIHAPLARSNGLPLASMIEELVSIHAPLARSNNIAVLFGSYIHVSIHAPLARSNDCGGVQ